MTDIQYPLPDPETIERIAAGVRAAKEGRVVPLIEEMLRSLGDDDD